MGQGGVSKIFFFLRLEVDISIHSLSALSLCHKPIGRGVFLLQGQICVCLFQGKERGRLGHFADFLEGLVKRVLDV